MSVLGELGSEAKLTQVLVQVEQSLLQKRPDLHAVLLGYGFFNSVGHVTAKEAPRRVSALIEQVTALGCVKIELAVVQPGQGILEIREDTSCRLH